MKKRILSFLMAFCMVVALLPVTVLAETATVSKIYITMTALEAGKPLPTDARTGSTANTQVTKVEWSGETDNGNMISGKDYTATFTVEIKPDKDAAFSTRSITATVNGSSTGVKVTWLSNSKVKVAYHTNPSAMPEVPVIDDKHYRMDLDLAMELPVGKVKAADSRVSVDEDRYTLLKVEWSGELDANGCFKEGVAYTVTVTERINNGYDGLFMKNSLLEFSTYSNGIAVSHFNKGTLVSISEDAKEITVSYTFEPAKADAETEAARKEAEEKAQAEAKAREHWETYKKQYYTKAQADAAWWVLNQEELILNGSEGGNRVFSTLDADQLSKITRVLLDYPNPDPSFLTSPWSANYQTCIHNIQEVWLSPKVDAKKFFSDLDAKINIDASGYDYPFHSGGYLNGKLTIFVPDTQMPKGLLSYSSSPTDPPYSVKVYSGDVYGAYKQGASAGRDWCPGHEYTGRIRTASRMVQNISCQRPNVYYYSCQWCGKCEYNSKHTFATNREGKLNANAAWGTHQYGVYDLSDKNYLGTNEKGEKVYLLSCVWCGINTRENDFSYTYAQFVKDGGSERPDNADTRKAYQDRMGIYKKEWAPGGGIYNQIMEYTAKWNDEEGRSFTVASGKDVTAKVSAWAQNEVNWAAQNDLIDTALLGSDYTGSVTRLQFCSVAVKMAERMLGKSITPAPSGTFTDTDNEYVRKAYAAGITSGIGDGKFAPDSTLTRQEMAAFIYRALMYVKDNSDIKYTIYDSKLGSYTDAGELAGWATEPMAFMNALGLIAGTGSATLSPTANCTIEQALAVANRSLQADLIGWYQSLGGTESNVYSAKYSTYKGGSNDKVCYFSNYTRDDGADFNQLRYRQSERFWVTGTTERPDRTWTQENYISMLKIIDPYTGDTLYVHARNFRPIKAD